MKYRKMVKQRKTGAKGSVLSEMPFAGFSKDDLRSWEFVVVADPDEYGIGFSEADIAQLDSGRIVAIYGNNQGTPHFFSTCSDDEGRSWSEMKQIPMRGECPSLIKLADGTLLAAYRNIPEDGALGIGLAASTDGEESWRLLGNILDQGGWDMAYPDLIRLDDGRLFCVFYTAAEKIMISRELEQRLEKAPVNRTLGFMRPSAYEELDGEIRGVFLRDLTRA